MLTCWDYLVTVHVTSTLRVSPSGEAGSTPSNETKVGLGVGLGLGLPIVFAAVGLGIWLCVRNQRRRSGLNTANAAPPTDPYSPNFSHDTPVQQTPAELTMSPASRKTLPSASVSHTPSPAPETQELTAQSIRRELGGTGITPFPSHSPSPPVAVPGQHEMSGQGTVPELQGMPGVPPPNSYQQVAYYQQYTTGHPSEMP